MRRYMVAVCTGGRLRGYVHDDGKNIYTKNPYIEPWAVKAGRGQDSRATELELLRGRLDDLITTGYVPPTHYDDKVGHSLSHQMTHSQLLHPLTSQSTNLPITDSHCRAWNSFPMWRCKAAITQCFNSPCGHDWPCPSTPPAPMTTLISVRWRKIACNHQECLGVCTGRCVFSYLPVTFPRLTPLFITTSRPVGSIPALWL